MRALPGTVADIARHMGHRYARIDTERHTRARHGHTHDRHTPTRTRAHGDMPSARAPYIRIGVFFCVLFCGLLLRKNGKKRGMCVEGVSLVCGQPSVCEGVRSNVCATGASPHCSPF